MDNENNDTQVNETPETNENVAENEDAATVIANLENNVLELELKIEELEKLMKDKPEKDNDSEEIGCVKDAKIEKLLEILSLEGDALSHIKGGVLQKLQVAEYYKEFPK